MDERKELTRVRNFGSLWPVAAQVAGGVMTVAGLGMLCGVAVAVLVGGLALLAAGTLREGGRI